MLLFFKIVLIGGLTLLAILNNRGKVKTFRRMKDSLRVTVALDFCIMILIIFLFR